MSRINKLLVSCLVVVLGFFAAACSSDEKTKVEVSFTAPSSLDMAALDSCESITASFEVTSTGDWHLYSDKMWVQLSQQPSGEFFNDINGSEGKHTIYIKVTADAREFENSVATVTLLAGDDRYVVTTIERLGKEHSFALVGADGNRVECVDLGSSATAWVAPSASFDCAILSYPLWLEEPVALNGGYTLNVATDYIPYQKEGVLLFGNIDGTLAYEIPVAYTGMDPDRIIIDGENSPWGWKVSLDGKTFLQESTTTTDENTEIIVENSLLFSATCFNYDYKLFALLVTADGAELVDAAESWIVATKSESVEGQISVSALPFEPTATERSRKAFLFAVPAAVSPGFISSFEASSDVDTFIDENQPFVVVEMEQRDIEGSDGFVITDAAGNASPTAEEIEHYEWLCSEFSITDVTTCNLVPGESYTIDTRLSASEWSKNFALTDLEGNQQRLKLWNIEAVLGSDGLYRITLTVPKSLNKTILLRLYTPQIVNIKALVIRPVTNN